MNQTTFRFKPFSKKQKMLLSWWHPSSVASNCDGIVADGAIRSGKTTAMALSFIIWAMTTYNCQNFGMCGKTIGSFRRNVMVLLKQILLSIGYDADERRADNLLIVRSGNTVNYFYIFGGKDERSQDLIQGVTLAGIFFDEVALMPESFVNQATARCSVDGSKWWFNCNPQGPQHWFKTGWIDKYKTKNLIYLHFTMNDNPSVTDKIRSRYESQYTGVFYDRYIRGVWKLAEGLVYPMFDTGRHVYDKPPWHDDASEYYISIDYGTLNPTSMGLWRLYNGVAYRTSEYYYSGREQKEQLTDEEYYSKLEQLAGDHVIQYVIVDPSAASFMATIRRHGKYTVRAANNAVLDGIRMTATALNTGRIMIHESCRAVINEFTEYCWDDKANEDKVIKQNDHCMDDMRYFVMTVLRRTM